MTLGELILQRFKELVKLVDEGVITRATAKELINILFRFWDLVKKNIRSKENEGNFYNSPF